MTVPDQTMDCPFRQDLVRPVSCHYLLKHVTTKKLPSVQMPPPASLSVHRKMPCQNTHLFRKVCSARHPTSAIHPYGQAQACQAHLIQHLLRHCRSAVSHIRKSYVCSRMCHHDKPKLCGIADYPFISYIVEKAPW